MFRRPPKGSAKIEFVVVIDARPDEQRLRYYYCCFFQKVLGKVRKVFCVVEKSITFLTVFERRRINRRRRRRRRRGFLATRGAETVLQRETNLLKTPGDDELGVVVELTQKVLDGLASVLIARGALR